MKINEVTDITRATPLNRTIMRELPEEPVNEEQADEAEEIIEEPGDCEHPRTR